MAAFSALLCAKRERNKENTETPEKLLTLGIQIGRATPVAQKRRSHQAPSFFAPLAFEDNFST